MLRVEDLNASYQDIQVVQNVSLSVKKGEIVALIGSNGAGKSTTLKVISGMHPARSGQVVLNGEDISSLPPSQRVEKGVVLVPEGHRIFPKMPVIENLEVARWTRRARAQKEAGIKKVFEMFPVLAERKRQMGGTLSGGEQQMLSIGQGLVCSPDLLLLDEPSLGLAPMVVQRIYETIRQINRLGTTILLVEQNVQIALEVASRGYVMENGQIVTEGASEDLLRDESIRRAYLGF